MAAKMVSLKLTQKEAKKRDEPPTLADRPKFPFGSQIHLENEVLDKLGMKTLPKVGATMEIMAKVEVTSVHSSERAGGGKDRSVGLQITDLGVSKASRKPTEEILAEEG